VRPYLKKTHHKKRAGEVAQGIGLEFKFENHKKQNNNKKYVQQELFGEERKRKKKKPNL
jgi:hypothetical protein